MRLRSDDQQIRESMLEGLTGLELEAHRIDKEGHLAQSPHPFPDDPYIDRDFSEAQIEINTPPMNSPGEALDFIHKEMRIAQTTLRKQGDLLWPFPIHRPFEEKMISRSPATRVIFCRATTTGCILPNDMGNTR